MAPLCFLPKLILILAWTPAPLEGVRLSLLPQPLGLHLEDLPQVLVQEGLVAAQTDT